MSDLRQDIKTIRFDYHEPNEEQVQKIMDLRRRAKDYALMIEAYAPDSREKSLAITKLEEAVMWTNAAIVRGVVDQ